MSTNAKTTALQRYHDHFDSKQYNQIGELVASDLNADRDDARVVAGMIALQDCCLELCGHPDHELAWHRLAVFCGYNNLSLHTVDAMLTYLRGFNADDLRLDDFECTAKALLHTYSGLEEIKTATSYANGVHRWRGRMAYELLAAADYLMQAAVQLLVHGSDAYIREKLQGGLQRITGALYEGVRHSDKPTLYDFKSTYFPDERDR